MWKNWLQYLLPKEEEQDTNFRDELADLAVIGLRVIAGVSIGAPLFLVTVGLSSAPEIQTVFRLGGAMGILLLGVVALAVSFWPPIRRYARLGGILIGYFVFVVQIWAQAGIADPIFIVPANVTMIMLVGIASLPLKPVHVMGLGVPMMVTFFLLAPFLGFPGDTLAQIPVLVVFVSQILLICTALAAVVYHQRVRAYRARREAQESFEQLRQAQSRLLVSENAASQGRFAAALSHELNSPIGALSSALETLLLAFEKVVKHPDQAPTIQDVIVGASSSARQSSQRLLETVARMKHLTNLDRAEEQVVDLNELWSSTVALLHNELEPKAVVKLDLRPLPRVKCRPQQLSAVFSNLLRNSAASIEGKGTIQVFTGKSRGGIVLEVRDDGRGIPRDRLEHLFDPAFRVEGSRVATTNWGLFISRSIITEHGGQIEIDSTEGQGTTARISLPASTAGSAGWM